MHWALITFLVLLAATLVAAAVAFPVMLVPVAKKARVCNRTVTHCSLPKASRAHVTSTWWMNASAVYNANGDLIMYTARRPPMNPVADPFLRPCYKMLRGPDENRLEDVCEPRPLRTGTFARALTDVRMFLCTDGTLVGVTSAQEGPKDKHERPILLDFGGPNLEATNHRKITYRNPSLRDKNWCPLVPRSGRVNPDAALFYTDHRDRKEIVIRTISGIQTDSPHEVAELAVPFSWTQRSGMFTDKFHYTMRGSTPWLETDTPGVYWTVMHFGESQHPAGFLFGPSAVCTYRHMMLEVDIVGRRVLRSSGLLCFDAAGHAGCQFATGFARDPVRPDEFVLSGGLSNKHNFLQRYTHSELEALFENIPQAKVN